MNALIEVPGEEIYELAAVDPELYCRHFFPKTFRQASPLFHRDFWRRMEDPEFDYFGAEIFRGGGKTTLTRVAASRRIAYGISRNILSVAISESMAIESLRWLKQQVQFNTAWAQTYKLQQGSKWADDRVEIYHGIFGFTINIVAKGMTSGLRGLNIDDYRPDLIICDDICNDENTKTEEQRSKTNDLLFGAIAPSLAPKSEAPLRKLVLLQTGLHKDDVINQAHKDPSWQTVKYPILVQDRDGNTRSAWEERFPVVEVQQQKEDYTRTRRLHIWLREYGLKLTSSEISAFDPDWLKFWTVLPVGMRTFIGIDPATDSKKKAHQSAIVVIGVFKGATYILDYMSQSGKNPDEIWVWLAAAVRNWHPRAVVVETIAYQKMLAWYLKKKMVEQNFFFLIKELQDRRSKADRIRQAFTGIASNGRLFVSENHLQFISAFTEYADEMDIDILDAAAMAISEANPWLRGPASAAADDLEGEFEDITAEEKGIPDLDWAGAAP